MSAARLLAATLAAPPLPAGVQRVEQPVDLTDGPVFRFDANATSTYAQTLLIHVAFLALFVTIPAARMLS